MTKLFYILFLSVVVISCGMQDIKTVTGRKVIDKKTKEEVLIGAQNVSAFKKYDWFKQEYDSYTPNVEVTKKLKNKFFLNKMIVFVGTWCPDSQKELPRLIKIFDQAKIPYSKMTIYAVNTKKESFYGEELKYGIRYVPTFIIYKKGTGEIGRIVEHPKENLESEILQILSGTYPTEE